MSVEIVTGKMAEKIEKERERQMNTRFARITVDDSTVTVHLEKSYSSESTEDPSISKVVTIPEQHIVFSKSELRNMFASL